MLPFVLIFIFTVGVIISVQKNSYEEMVSDISDKQLSALTEKTLELNNFLNQPFQASLALSHSIGFNRLYRSGDTSDIEQYFLTAFRHLYHTFPQLDVIGFGGETAEYIGFRKESNSDYTLMVQDARTDYNLVIYRGEELNEEIRSVIENYDPRIDLCMLPLHSH